MVAPTAAVCGRLWPTAREMSAMIPSACPAAMPCAAPRAARSSVGRSAVVSPLSAGSIAIEAAFAISGMTRSFTGFMYG